MRKSSGQKVYIQEVYSPRCSRTSEDTSTSDPDEGTSGLQLQESGNEFSDQQ